MSEAKEPIDTIQQQEPEPDGPRMFEWASDAQKEAVEHPPGPPLLMIGGFNGLALNTPIPTPSGWTAMGDLKAGDLVFDERGTVCRVKLAHDPYQPERMYRIVFSDNSEILADGEHRWSTFDHASRKAFDRSGGTLLSPWSESASVRKTYEIATTQKYARSIGYPETNNHSIPNAWPLELPLADLPIDPYVLGVWLGDGTSVTGAYTSDDPWIAEEIARRGYRTTAHEHKKRTTTYRVSALTKSLRVAGLLNNKHIPAAYLRASIGQRLDLLRGLMDTDGTPEPKRKSSFSNTNRALVDGVYELICSLGMRPSIRERRAMLRGRDCGPVWEVSVRQLLEIFALPRKKDLIVGKLGAKRQSRSMVRYIKSVVVVEPQTVRCITVDSPSELFLAGRQMVPTHNSGKTSAAILHMLALCDNFPGYKVAVLRKTFKDLSMTTRPSFDQWIDPKRVKVSNATEVVLDNGSSFIFHHLDSPNSATVLRGLEINAAILDQAEQMQERTFTILLGRLGRWKGARVPKWVLNSYDGEWPWKNKNNQPVPPISCILTANPTEDGDPELHWLWQRFSLESKQWQDKWSKQGYQQILMPTTGNKFASEQNVALLLQQDEDYVRRYVKGEWVRSKGHLFRLDEASILDYSPELVSFIENNCLLGRVLDHGDSAPTCCLWYGVDQYHNCFFWQEYYQPGITEDGKEFNVADHRRSITQLSRPLTFRINIADASIFDKTRNISGYTRRQNRWSVADEYCLSPLARVLTADLKHVPVGELQVGDELAAFEEYATRGSSHGQRQWKRGVVERTGRALLPSYRINFDDGTEIVASDGHGWLRGSGAKGWVATRDLRVGDRLSRVVDVWETDNSRGGGYLAAAFDGEGFLTQVPGTYRTGFSQRDNAMLAKVRALLDERGIHYSQSMTGDVTNLYISRRAELLRLLGSLRPERLLPKVDFDNLGRIHRISTPTIVAIEFLGDQEVVTLRTSTHTVISEGIMSHNTDRKIINEDTTLAWTPADKNEALSRQRLSQYLRLDPKHRHPITGDLGAPHIYLVARSNEHPHGIDHAIREIRNAKRLAVGENDGKPIYSDERDPSIPDHALDCVRYVVNSHPIPASAPREEVRTSALAQGDGRVIVTLPPVQKDGRPFVPKRDRFVKGLWKSRGGGGY